MRCPSCGKNNPDNAAFCGSCGEKLESIPSSLPASNSIATSISVLRKYAWLGIGAVVLSLTGIFGIIRWQHHSFTIIQTQANSKEFPSGYTITDLGVLPGRNESQAFGITKDGQVIGGSDGGKSVDGKYNDAQLFSWRNGNMTSLGPGGALKLAVNNHGDLLQVDGVQCWLYQNGSHINLEKLPELRHGNLAVNAFNDSCQVIGSGGIEGSYDSSRNFIWQDGQITILPKNFIPKSINNHGTIAGEAQPTTRTPSGNYISSSIVPNVAIWRNATLTYVTKWKEGCTVIAINDADDVIGTLHDANGKAFLWHQGEVLDLNPLPGAKDFKPLCISNKGLVVGESEYASRDWKPTLWKAGKAIDMTEMLPPNNGWQKLYVTGINDQDCIVGVGQHQGKYRAFLMTPN